MSFSPKNTLARAEQNALRKLVIYGIDHGLQQRLHGLVYRSLRESSVRAGLRSKSLCIRREVLDRLIIQDIPAILHTPLHDY